jgi:glycosyltransferase involved in cell wall biosynthesis
MVLKSNKEPFISIVMPTYNQAEFLSYSIESVVNQTFTNWELLIVDNFSTDETSKVLDTYTDPRIRKFQINNGGVIARSRNHAIKASEGEWIAFLDSDDFWFPEKLQSITKLLHSDFELIYHHMKVINSKNEIINHELIKSRRLKKPIFKDLIINGNTVATSSVVVRKNRLMEISCMNEASELIGVEDFNTWLRISRNTEAFKLVSAELGAYRRHEKNNSFLKSLNIDTEAYKEFLPELTYHDKRMLNFSQLYTVARLKYLNKDYNNLKKELSYLVFRGKFQNKVKSFWMLMNSFKS